MSSYGPGVYGALAAASAAAALLACPAVAVAAERCARSAGRIVAVERGVEVAVGNGWRAVGLDQDLCVQDLLRTGPAGAGAVQLGDGTVLRVDQGTTLRVEGAADRRGFVVRLIEGVVSIFSRRAVALSVDTPFANAAVEGTEFVVAVASGRTRVAVLEGRVRVSNPQGELRLNAGGVAVARAGEAPVLELDVRPRDAVRWALYYPPVSPDLLAGRPEADLSPAVRDSLRLRREGRAQAALSRLDDVPPSGRDALAEVLRAELSLASGRPDEAAAAIDRALALDPSSGEALALRAVIAVARNDQAGALADARRAVALRPASAAARLALAYAQQAAFDLDAARATLAEAARRAPADALVRARLAEIELARGDLRAARRGAAEAARLAPDQARARLAEGFVALAGLNTRAAKAAFARAIALDSLDPQARLGQGLARIRDGDLEGGRADLELAVALDPGNALLRSYLGKAYLDERRDGLAGDELTTAKELDSNDPTPWFYDAIRKQQANRPAEALRDLEEAVERNESRAVYRSRLLLDQDRASRGTSLARIYEELGFERLGVIEAARSLSADPANAAAHRFLADLYRSRPRADIARVSELLQAQLLAPLDPSPLQSGLAISDLDRTAVRGPPGGFGEYGPLFERDGIGLTVAGLAGSEATFGEELVVSVRRRRTVLAFGQLHDETNGFRRDDEVETDAYAVLAQAVVTPALSLQAEYRFRETDRGDVELRFDPDLRTSDRNHVNQHTGRLGARLALAPGHTFIVSGIATDRDERIDALEGSVIANAGSQGGQLETQYLRTGELLNFRAGAGYYRFDSSVDIAFDDISLGATTAPRAQRSAYAYADVTPSKAVALTLGLQYDSFDQARFNTDRLSPKLGFQLQPTRWAGVRGAYYGTLKRALVADQTIEPVQIAGFEQLHDDLNASETDGFGLALDLRPGERVAAGAEWHRRDLRVPVFASQDRKPIFRDQEEDTYSLYAYWFASDRWTAAFEPAYHRFDLGEPRPGISLPETVDTWKAPLTARWFAPSGLFASLSVGLIYQDVRNAGEDDGEQSEGDRRGILVDAEMGWRLPGGRGRLAIEVDNVLDTKLYYRDENYLDSEIRRSGLSPERSLFGRLILTF